MKFQGSQNLPPHQDRRLQLRMLGFVGLIALAMFAWQAWRVSSRPKADARRTAISPDQLDFSVEEEPASPLRDDEVRIVPRQPRRDADELREPAERGEDSPVDVNPAWLEDVHDNTIGIRQNETEACYRILAKVRTVPPRELQARAVQDMLYVNLMTSPEKYRGRPITITGELWKLYEFQAAKNDFGLGRLYEAWIFTPDSGTHPYRVVCSSIPPELKPNVSSRVSVKVTGYFFKREGYETGGGRLHVAPTLLADRLSLYVSPQAPPPVDDVVPWLIGVISVIGLTLLATVLGYALSDARANRRRRLHQHVDAVPVELLGKADRQISIEESLRRLAEGEFAEEEQPARSFNGNGHHDLTAEAADEIVDLPTPFPPTRVPRRWDER